MQYYTTITDRVVVAMDFGMCLDLSSGGFRRVRHVTGLSNGVHYVHVTGRSLTSLWFTPVSVPRLITYSSHMYSPLLIISGLLSLNRSQNYSMPLCVMNSRRNRPQC